MLATGIVEFGRAFMIVHMVVHAAREGARFASTLPGSYRDQFGCLTAAGRTSATNHIETIIEETIGTSVALGEVDIDQSLDGDVPVVTVRITGSVDYVMLMGMLGDGFDIDRTMMFRDEGRDDGATC